MEIVAIDLFCGAGGLTCGLQQAGVKVVAGIDLDHHCRHAFESNNKSEFIRRNVAEVSPSEVASLFGEASIRLLAGCAPCQTFSTYSHGKKAKSNDDRWQLLYRFAELVEANRPELVTMENVTGLRNHAVFSDFVRRLQASGYHVNASELYGPNVGLAQTRKRLVIVASRLGWPSLIKPPAIQSGKMTVRAVIQGLPALSAGHKDSEDLLHRAGSLSPLQLERIKTSKPGGTWRDWPVHLQANCHAGMERPSYVSVYGRMEWDRPSPTITTQFYGIGHGRFGHPEQDRAISPREASLLQGFPDKYSFICDDGDFAFNRLGRMIGNAVPVPFGKLIGDSLLRHVSEKT